MVRWLRPSGTAIALLSTRLSWPKGIDAHWDASVYGELLNVAGGRERLEYYFVKYESRSKVAARALAKELHIVKTKRFVDIVESGQIQPRPGVRELVHDLQAKAVTIGIVTTGRRAWVEPLVSTLIGRAAYDRLRPLVTGDDVQNLKPSPEAYLLAMDQLKLAPYRVVAIEDSITGLRSAKAAGVACVAVPSLYNVHHDFGAADLVVPAFDQAPVADGVGDLMHNVEFQALVFGS